jgi:hypothetical protein
MTKTEARKLAFANAAALLEAMNLDELYGGTTYTSNANDEDALEELDEARLFVVAYLRKAKP